MTMKFGTLATMVILGFVLSGNGLAQASADIQTLGKEIAALKEGQAVIQRELQEIKGLLQQAGQAAQAGRAAVAAPGAPVPAEITDVMLSVAGAPFKGEKDAKVTVVEFTDYQCPFCSRHFRQTWPQLEQDYVKTGKARFVVRDLPILAIHPQAFKASEAAGCAAEQGKFWEMHDILFGSQAALGRKDLSAYAQALALNVAVFDQCVDSGKTAERIRQDIADSEKVGARGTPIFYLGLTDPNGTQVKAVRIIRGAHSYATFKEAIDGLLASAK